MGLGKGVIIFVSGYQYAVGGRELTDVLHFSISAVVDESSLFLMAPNNRDTNPPFSLL